MKRRFAVLAAALAVLSGCGGAEDDAAPGVGGRPGSTLERTLVDPDGDGALALGPGEALRDRRELGAAGRRRDRVLATWAQITDPQVRDEETPARVPFLDRLGDPFNSTFRPHEALSTQVLNASVRAVNAARPQAVVVTGDLLESAQANELSQALAVLDGGRVEPDTGARGYDGIQAADNPDPLYYRPDNDAPRRPGLLARAQRPFIAPGLAAPWYPALGNHDVLVAGEVRSSPAIERVATGAEAVVGLDPGYRPEEGMDSATAVEALLASDELPGRTISVPADPARRHLTPEALAARLPRVPRSGRLDYGFDIGANVRGIVLDTVNRAGGARGVLAPDQVAWLGAELARAGDRRVVVFSHNPLDATDGGEAALAVLDRSPRVVAAVSGNRHRNVIEPRRAGSPGAGAGGYWLIGTSSLADFPQQARAFRLVEAAGGGVLLETWMLDHDGTGLAGTARELAYLDAQGGRPKEFAGEREDRNAHLHVPAR